MPRDDLGRVLPRRLSGAEAFRGAEGVPDFDVLDFWRWSSSDLVSNATRGVLAEYIVGKALGCRLEVRDEWAPYDLETPEGYGIEVKSAAYVQSWRQSRLSTISFSCRKTRYWDPETGIEEAEPRRHAHAYVFALLAHRDQATLDPLDLSQWEFYAVPTAWLDDRTRSQHSITLPSLRREFAPLPFASLRDGVYAAIERHLEMRGREE